MFSSRALTSAVRAAAPRTPIAARFAATRSYAAAAAPTSSQNKPPVALFGIDGTYASALVRLPGGSASFLRLKRPAYAPQWLPPAAIELR